MNMRTENAFEIDLEQKLSEKNFDSVLETITDPGNDVFIQSNVWNLINTVCLTLKTKELLTNGEDLDVCKKILLNLADRGNPKEVIVALMEEADSFKSHMYFCLLLDPLKLTLKKVPSKRGKSLEWVFSSLNAHIQTLPIPNDLDLQGEEKLLLDVDPAVQDANFVLSHYLDFLNAFLEEVSYQTVSSSDDGRVAQQRGTLQRFILMLLHHPFLFHDLHVESPNKPKSTSRMLCESFISSLSFICRNVFLLFSLDTRALKGEDEDLDDVVPPLAFSNLAYLIYAEDLTVNFQPFIYSHLFTFTNTLKYINLLLDRKENLVLFKGLQLAQILVDRLEDLNIVYDFIELSSFIEFPRLLLSVGIYSQFEEHRHKAVKVFTSFVNKCDWKGRYHVINQVISTINHSGAEGLAINLYKTYLHSYLTGETADTYFIGENLTIFLKKVFSLKEGVETDLLEHSDKILTALNFLRYLLLRDKKSENVTGVWDLLSDISEKFLDPLLTGIDMSRAHYKHVEKESREERKSTKKKANASASHGTIPDVSQHVQKEVFEKALLTFEMMESVLFRVKELL